MKKATKYLFLGMFIASILLNSCNDKEQNDKSVVPTASTNATSTPTPTVHPTATLFVIPTYVPPPLPPLPTGIFSPFREEAYDPVNLVTTDITKTAYGEFLLAVLLRKQ